MVYGPLVALLGLLAYSFISVVIHYLTTTENPHWSYLEHYKHHSAETINQSPANAHSKLE